MSEIHIHINRRVPRPEKRPTRLNALILWLTAAVGLVLFPLITPLLDPLIGGFNIHVQLLICNLMYYLPFSLLPVMLLARRRPGLFMAYRPNPISLFNTICVVVAALLGVFLANDLAVLWSIPLQKLGFDVLGSSLPAAANSTELVLSIIYVAVLPGVCEEFLFRGAVMSAFEDQGSRHAMRVSALMFMLVHGTIAGAPVQFILGFILAYLVFWTDSIYAALIYHTVHNAATVILQYVQNRTVPAAAAQTTDLLELIGGAEGIAVLLLELLFSGAMMIFTLKMFRLRGLLTGIAEEPRKKKPLENWDLILVLVGIIPCVLLYFIDLCSRTNILGG